MWLLSSILPVVVIVVHYRLDWPVRTLSFSYDGHMLASASEDLVIDIADVDTGKQRNDLCCSLSLSVSLSVCVCYQLSENLLQYCVIVSCHSSLHFSSPGLCL